MKILLGITGSVAAILAPKLISALSEIGEVKTVLTPSAEYFCFRPEFYLTRDKELWAYRQKRTLFLDKDEWTWKKKGDPVLHVDLRNWADVMVLAPLTANTLAKIANGLSDNLVTSLVRAWTYPKPLVVAPSMNTAMWNHPMTNRQICTLEELSISIVPPTTKVLACGDVGEGAMANIPDIVSALDKRWNLHRRFLKGAFGNKKS